MAQPDTVICVGLNPAIDRVIEVRKLAIGAHATGQVSLRQPAGKGVNVSRALALLGRDSIISGFIGQGDQIPFEQFLNQAGPGRVSCRLLPVAGLTRENITLIDPVNHTDTHIREVGFQVGRADLRRLQGELASLTGRDTVTVFTGSLPPGVSVDQLRKLIEISRATGGKVALDLSGKVLRELLREPLPRLLLIKPNRQEIGEALGLGDVNDDDALLDAARTLARAARWVALSLGPQGALLVHKDSAWRGHVPADAALTIDTVGCGDCMLAGVLDGLLDGAEPTQMLRRGLVAATANARVFGAANFEPAQARDLAKAAVVQAI